MSFAISNLPTWWQKHWFWASAVALLVLAIGLIFYKLGDVPHGMTWDEAAIGYNGYAVISKRRDEWLVRLPVSFKSFGDYKAPFAIYLNGFFTYILGDKLGWGMTLWLVRLPFALASVMAVIGMGLLSWEVWRSAGQPTAAQPSLTKRPYQFLTLLSLAFLITSPWFLHFARTGFESGMALAFIVWGIWALLKVLNFEFTTSTYFKWLKWPGLVYLTMTATSLSLALYTYHSAKIVVPLLVAFVLLLNWQKTWQKWLWIGLIAVLSLVMLRPLLLDTLYGNGAERFEQSSVLSLNISAQEKFITMAGNYATHLTPGFWLFGETPTVRHGDGAWGVLLPSTFALMLVGIVVTVGLSTKSFFSSNNDRLLISLGWFSLGWIVIGLVPAAIGVDVPHSNRALLALPGVILLATVGYAYMCEWVWNCALNKKVHGSHGEKNSVWQATVGAFWLLHIIFSMAYLRHYYTDFARLSAEDFKDGYLEALSFVIPYEKGSDGKTKVDQVVFTSKYGQPYIYTLFARKTDPIWYQGGVLNTYLFTDKITVGDLDRPNTVIVASGSDELPLEKADKVVYGSDGQVRFKIYVNQ